MDMTLKEKKTPRSRKKKGFPAKGLLVTAVFCIAVAGGAFGGYYIYKGHQYKTVFFPMTTINGVDASQKTVEEVKELIASGIDGYTLTIHGRNGGEEKITKEQIGLHSVFDGSLEQYLAAQKLMDWWSHRGEETQYQIKTMIAYDPAKLESRFKELSFFDAGQMTEPRDAYLSGYVPGSGYSIIPEQDGTKLDLEAAKAAIAEAVVNLKTELSLEELGVYKEPEVTAEDPRLKETAETLNRYVSTQVTYTFGDKREILGGDTIASWLSVEADGSVTLNREQAASYVKSLASRYDTAYKPKKLKTSYGKTVTIEKGFYGWRMDQAKETEALCEILASGESQTREPVYKQKAASHGADDYGGTYVEINLTAQHLFFYKNGKLVTETDFVSGNLAKGYGTPSGAYPLTYKQKDAVLRGKKLPNGKYEYESPVDFWMPFNGGIGLHDAKWRSSFGGAIYKTGGSHGCINLPHAAAKKIFEQISPGDPVLCYELPGTEQGGSGSTPPAEIKPAETKPAETKPAETKPTEIKPAETKPTEIKPAETTPAETKPAETTPAETKPAETKPAGGGNPDGPGGPGSIETDETPPAFDGSNGSGPSSDSGGKGDGPGGPGAGESGKGPGGPGAL